MNSARSRWNQSVPREEARPSGGSGTVLLDGFLTVWYVPKFGTSTQSSPPAR